MKTETQPTLETLEALEDHHFISKSLDSILAEAQSNIPPSSLSTDYHRAYALQRVMEMMEGLELNSKKNRDALVGLLAGAIIRLIEAQAPQGFSE